MQAVQAEYMTVGEVAALLRLSAQRVRELSRAGQLPGRRLAGGRRLLFHRGDLVKLLRPAGSAAS